MLGAIIGDLAAWTWQQDKDVFYRQLIADDAPISEYSATMLAMAKPVFERQSINWDTLLPPLFHYLNEDVDKSPEIREWLNSGTREIPVTARRLMVDMMNAAAGWAGKTALEAKGQARKISDNLECCKEGMYATISLSQLIWNLRHGMTKDKAIQAMGYVCDIVIDWEHKQEDGPLSAIARAWGAFYRAFDFTSTIHRAVKSPINPRLTAAIAGELAEAMYGCELGFLKKKYTDNTSFWIKLPNRIQTQYVKELEYLKEHTERDFFPKNCTQTNVELHRWTPVRSEYEGKVINAALFRTLLQAFNTDWEHRYGVYWDNGWFYVYRCFVLICRFRVKIVAKDAYQITHMQQGDEMDDHEIAMDNVFQTLKEIHDR